LGLINDFNQIYNRQQHTKKTKQSRALWKKGLAVP